MQSFASVAVLAAVVAIAGMVVFMDAVQVGQTLRALLAGAIWMLSIIIVNISIRKLSWQYQQGRARLQSKGEDDGC